MKRRTVFFIVIALFIVCSCIGCNMLHRTEENSANATDSPFMPISYESYVNRSAEKYFIQIVHADDSKNADISEYCRIIDTVIGDAGVIYDTPDKEQVATVYMHQFTSGACTLRVADVYKDNTSGELFVFAQAPGECSLQHGPQGVIELSD